MPTLQIVSTKPRTGRTTVAAALAYGLREAGVTGVRLVRVGSGADAEHDAKAFVSLGVATAMTAPVSASQVKSDKETLSIVEVEGEPLPAPALLVIRGVPEEADLTLAKKLGDRLIGTIATVVTATEVESVARELTNAGLKPLAVLSENQELATPSVGQIQDALSAEVLHDGENAAAAVDAVLVAPIYTDGARTHFRRFASKAVLTPFYKTDLLLAAVDSGAACVVVTGGSRPSHYVLDRAQGEETTILLTGQSTVPTVTALSEVWTNSPFSGLRKAEVAWSLIAGQIDLASLQGKLAG